MPRRLLVLSGLHRVILWQTGSVFAVAPWGGFSDVGVKLEGMQTSEGVWSFEVCF